METETQQHAALQTWQLTKVYEGGAPAVAEVSLWIPPGTLYGVVGPNGAGKTTLMSMATGLVRPSSGGAWIDGHDVWGDPVLARGRVGMLPDGPALPVSLPGGRAVEHVGVLQGLAPALARERTAELLAVLGLSDAADQSISTYSAGMTKKIGLAAALVHGPRLLVLDEPLEAVDPVSARTIRGLLESFVERGGTALVSSHSMLLIEQMCTHVAILDRGRLRAAGTLAEVRGDDSLEDVIVRMAEPGDGPRDLPWLGR